MIRCKLSINCERESLKCTISKKNFRLFIQKLYPNIYKIPKIYLYDDLCIHRIACMCIYSIYINLKSYMCINTRKKKSFHCLASIASGISNTEFLPLIEMNSIHDENSCDIYLNGQSICPSFKCYTSPSSFHIFFCLSCLPMNLKHLFSHRFISSLTPSLASSLLKSLVLFDEVARNDQPLDL